MGDLDKIIKAYREILLEEHVADIEKVRRAAETLGPDGRWPDVDYVTNERHAWTAVRHLTRCRRMALAWAGDEGPLHGDESLLAALRPALKHWVDEGYQSCGWWWNQIGVPRAMRDIVVALDDALSGELRAGAIGVIGQFRLGGTAANLLWSAELALHHGCLTGREEQVARAARAIEEEITVGQAEGIQDDWSFFQHAERLQAFHYGRSYLEIAVDMAWQLRGTRWEFPPEKLEVVTNYILEGLQWMCRGTATVPATLDRAVTRRGYLRHGADIRPWLRRWLGVCPTRKEEVAAFLARLEGRGRPLVGFRHFPRADFTAYHRPGFSLFVKTVSERTLPTEHINRENLKGEHLHSGDHYLLRDGDEYADLVPVWDWERLPGVTLAAGAPALRRCSFVGGVGDGRGGLAAMDYRREEDDGGPALSVRKTWAFHGDAAVCLMADWGCRALAGPVYTAIEQCRLREAPLVAEVDAEPRPLASGRHELASVEWVLHAGVAYMPLEPAALTVRAGRVTGSWRSVSGGASDEPVSAPVFCATLEHGRSPEPCGFAIVGGVDREDVRALVRRPPWQVLRNDPACQAVRFEGGPHMAAFWQADSVGEGLLMLATDAPCLALWTEGELWLCDPTQSGRGVCVEWRGRKGNVRLPAGGRPVCIGRTRWDV